MSHCLMLLSNFNMVSEQKVGMGNWIAFQPYADFCVPSQLLIMIGVLLLAGA